MAINRKQRRGHLPCRRNLKTWRRDTEWANARGKMAQTDVSNAAWPNTSDRQKTQCLRRAAKRGGPVVARCSSFDAARKPASTCLLPLLLPAAWGPAPFAADQGPAVSLGLQTLGLCPQPPPLLSGASWTSLGKVSHSPASPRATAPESSCQSVPAGVAVTSDPYGSQRRLFLTQATCRLPFPCIRIQAGEMAGTLRRRHQPSMGGGVETAGRNNPALQADSFLPTVPHRFANRNWPMTKTGICWSSGRVNGPSPQLLQSKPRESLACLPNHRAPKSQSEQSPAGWRGEAGKCRLAAETWTALFRQLMGEQSGIQDTVQHKDHQ